MSDLKAVLPHCIGGLFAVFFAILTVALIGNAHSSAFKVTMTGAAFGIGLFGYVVGVWTAYLRGGTDELNRLRDASIARTKEYEQMVAWFEERVH